MSDRTSSAIRSTITEATLPEHAALCKVEYGPGVPGANVDHLRWQYLQGPAGESFVDTVREPGGPAFGRIAYWPRRFRSGAGDRRALFLVELLIDARRRSLGAFVQLMRQVRDHPAADFVFVVPNDTSAPLYQRVLGFEPVGALQLTGLPLRPERLLHGRRSAIVRWLATAAGGVGRLALRAVLWPTPSVRLTEDVPSADELGTLTNSLYRDDAWIGDRDHAFHVWRFLSDPIARYRVRYAYDRSGFAGYAVCRIADLDEVPACVILDCIAAGPRWKRVTRALVADVITHARRERAGVVAALSFGDTNLTRGLRRFPLLRVPQRFSPQQMPLFVEPVGEQAGTERPRLSVTLADMDNF